MLVHRILKRVIPDDQLAWMKQRRRLFYFSDVMLRGYYQALHEVSGMNIR